MSPVCLMVYPYLCMMDEGLSMMDEGRYVFASFENLGVSGSEFETADMFITKRTEEAKSVLLYYIKSAEIISPHFSLSPQRLSQSTDRQKPLWMYARQEQWTALSPSPKIQVVDDHQRYKVP